MTEITNEKLKIKHSYESNGITEYLSILIAKEDSKLVLADQSYHMFKNDLILCRENIPYSLQEGKLCSLHFESRIFDSLFYSQIADCRILYEFMQVQASKNEHLFFYLPDTYDVNTFANMLEYEMTHPSIYDEKMYRLTLVGLFTCLDRCRQDHLIVQNSTMISDNRFGRLMKYIGENYGTCSLAEVAEKFGYNPDYLSVRFKLITGVTFTQKLLDIRLTEAANILISSTLKVEEISANVGFSDKSWFIKKFTEKYGKTPSAYRRYMRNQLNLDIK